MKKIVREGNHNVLRSPAPPSAQELDSDHGCRPSCVLSGSLFTTSRCVYCDINDQRTATADAAD